MDVLDTWYNSYKLHESEQDQDKEYDLDVVPVKCLEHVDFSDVDEEGVVDCLTAAECTYHGKTLVYVMPVCSEAKYIQTYYSPATWDDPAEEDGYYEVSEDEEVGDSYCYIFSSAEYFNKIKSEYYKLPYDVKRKTSLYKWLEDHQDVEARTYYKDSEEFIEDDPICYMSYEQMDKFFNAYLDVVDAKGHETDIGEKDTINSYHKKMMDIEAEIDRACGKV